MKKELFIITSLIVGSEVLAQEQDKKKFEVYGFVQTDYVQDFNRVDGNWKDTLRPSRIPTKSGAFGQDLQATLSARQSRFGVQGNLPVDGNNLYTKLEIDLFGVGVDEGQTTIRLRHAYGEWKQWLAGQTHSLFMNIDVFPTTIDYWGPNGMVFLRNPQIRFTPIKGENTFAIAIEKPSDDIDSGKIREISPEFGDRLQSNERMPDITAMYRMERDWGHFQASGILRRIGYETLDSSHNKPRDEKWGYGVSLSSNFKFFEKDRLILSATAGEGIASYMNDGGTDLAPRGTGSDIKGATVPLYALVAYYDHYWSEKFSSSIGYSRTQVDNTNFQSSDAFHRGEYASLNLLHYPGKNMMIGGEFLWGSRQDKNGAYGDDMRTQISFKYSFSSLDF